jgi:hypothetical protein
MLGLDKEKFEDAMLLYLEMKEEDTIQECR